MARPRIGWENLSDSQRDRYIAAGRTGRLTGEPFLDEAQVRAYYDEGGSLAGGRGHLVYDKRGHTKSRPSWAAPKEPTEKAQVNLLGTTDKAALRKWRRSRSVPKWIPASSEKLRDDVAAILSEIDVGPQRWTKVEVYPLHNGRYSLRIFIRGRETEFLTTLPDWDAVSDLGRLLNDFSRINLATSKAERKRLEREWKSKTGKNLAILVDIADTDVKSRKVEAPVALQRPVGRPRALPTKKGTTMKEASAKPAVKIAEKKAAKKPVKKATKVAAKKTIKKETPKRARNLRDVSARLLDLEALLKPFDALDGEALMLLNNLIKDVEGLIG
jgi:hypothetical protein